MFEPIRSASGAQLLLLIFAACSSADGFADELSVAGRISHRPLDEVSGIVRASYPGRFWVHNDSGDSARLFTIDARGTVLLPPFLEDDDEKRTWPGLAILNARNVDWEDIALSPDNVLYIIDMGNNGNARRDLGVYVLEEPNPLAVDSARATKFLPVRYPDQHVYPARLRHFDCEAAFYSDAKLYFLTKHRKPKGIRGWETGTKLYRLDTEHTDRVNVLTLISTMPELLRATAADLSPDGGHLAVATSVGVWLFARPEQGDDWLAGASRFIKLPRRRLKSVEAVTWLDDAALLLANEQRDLMRLELSSLPGH